MAKLLCAGLSLVPGPQLDLKVLKFRDNRPARGSARLLAAFASPASPHVGVLWTQIFVSPSKSYIKALTSNVTVL